MADIRRGGCKVTDFSVSDANNFTSSNRAHEVGDFSWASTNFRIQLRFKFTGEKAENHKQRSVSTDFKYDYFKYISRAGAMEAGMLQFSDG